LNVLATKTFECLGYLQPYLRVVENLAILSLTSSRKIRTF